MPRRTARPPDGRIFQTARAGITQDSAYAAKWAKGRKKPPHPGAAPVAIGLRHAAVSPWLNCGAPAAEVARCAGHGVAVLPKACAHRIDGQADAAGKHITGASALSTLGKTL